MASNDELLLRFCTKLVGSLERTELDDLEKELERLEEQFDLNRDYRALELHAWVLEKNKYQKVLREIATQSKIKSESILAYCKYDPLVTKLQAMKKISQQNQLLKREMNQISEQLNSLMEDKTLNKGALKDKIENLANTLSFCHKFLHQMAESQNQTSLIAQRHPSDESKLPRSMKINAQRIRNRFRPEKQLEQESNQILYCSMPNISHSYATNNPERIVGAILTSEETEDTEESINERIKMIKEDLEKIHRQQETTEAQIYQFENTIRLSLEEKTIALQKMQSLGKQCSRLNFELNNELENLFNLDHPQAEADHPKWSVITVKKSKQVMHASVVVEINNESPSGMAEKQKEQNAVLRQAMLKYKQKQQQKNKKVAK